MNTDEQADLTEQLNKLRKRRDVASKAFYAAKTKAEKDKMSTLYNSLSNKMNRILVSMRRPARPKESSSSLKLSPNAFTDVKPPAAKSMYALELERAKDSIEAREAESVASSPNGRLRSE